MAGEKAKGGKKNRKFNRNRNSHQNNRYKAEGRLEKNKRRSIAREERKQWLDDTKSARRQMLRKLGAVRRLERRIAEAHDKGKPTGKLNESVLKAKQALVKSGYGVL